MDTGESFLPASSPRTMCETAPDASGSSNVLESTSFNTPSLLLDLESGDQFRLNKTNARALQKAWGFESDLWFGLELELSLGTYKDWNKDPPEDRETVVARAVSPRPQGNGTQVIAPPRPPLKGEMDDEIPF